MKIRVIRQRRRRSRSGALPVQRNAVGRRDRLQRAISPRVTEQVTRLVLDVGDRASAWRDAAFDAELAYRWWRVADQADRDDAAAAYLAAIEREEKAAAEYIRALEACRNTLP
jgi:hypothetical protein